MRSCRRPLFRAFPWVVAPLLACAATFTLAQTPSKSYRVGWLQTGVSPPPGERAQGDFQLAMKDLGYVEGRNYVIEYRYANGDIDRLPQLAKELSASGLDVIVTAGDSAALAAKRATSSVPVIVSEVAADPVKAGIVASLGRPEANVTGLVTQSEELWEKRLSVFKRIAPIITRAVVLWNPANPANNACIEELRATAPAQGIKVQLQPVSDVKSIEGARVAVARERPDSRPFGEPANPTSGARARR